jgi:hypothetical protein
MSNLGQATALLTVVFLLFGLDECLDKALKQFPTLLSIK